MGKVFEQKFHKRKTNGQQMQDGTQLSLVIREIKTKTHMKYCSEVTRMAKI